MVAIELHKNSEIKINKEASSKKIRITALNHFSTGDLINNVKDDTFKLFILIVGAILTVGLVITIVTQILRKMKRKDKKLTTFDMIDGMLIQADLAGVNSEEESSRMPSDSVVSGLTEFRYGMENPNDISNVFIT